MTRPADPLTDESGQDYDPNNPPWPRSGGSADDNDRLNGNEGGDENDGENDGEIDDENDEEYAEFDPAAPDTFGDFGLDDEEAWPQPGDFCCDDARYETYE